MGGVHPGRQGRRVRRHGGGRAEPVRAGLLTEILTGLLAAAAGLLLLWLFLVVFLALARPKGATLGEAVRLLPDLLRLVTRLARDPALPRGVRIRLWLLLAYLAMPIDLVPDFIPVLGYADDAILVAFVLRSVIRRAGPEAVARHWPGDENGGLAAVRRLTRT
ncbi:hypothetical protein GCM10023196_034120 [Actinoallomurus vinaceus]|uniref:DUF1232 domain-containing protein n=1 Tax=Actinoallomurus vinaceus TaxID=1080074 RepID=A0ABP8UB90_9ACTN